MTPDTFLAKARTIERKLLAQGLLRSTLLTMQEGATTSGDGESEYFYRMKLHTLLDETLDTSDELVKLKEIFVKSNR